MLIADDVKTQDLTVHLLKAWAPFREEVHESFLVRTEDPKAVVQRIRMQISRIRKRATNQGKRPARFVTKYNSYPWTDYKNGIHYTCIVMWVTIPSHVILTEIFEEVLNEK